MVVVCSTFLRHCYERFTFESLAREFYLIHNGFVGNFVKRKTLKNTLFFFFFCIAIARYPYSLFPFLLPFLLPSSSSKQATRSKGHRTGESKTWKSTWSYLLRSTSAAEDTCARSSDIQGRNYANRCSPVVLRKV